jgi:magnesium transporter
MRLYLLVVLMLYTPQALTLHIIGSWRFLLQEIANNGFRWINATKPDRDQMKKLQQRFPFHELNLEDSLSKIQIPKIDRYDDHIFILLLFPSVGYERVPKSSQLSVFIGSDYLVTVHQGDLNPVIDMFQQCSQSEKSRQEHMGKSAGYLFHSIIDALSDNLLDYIRKIVGNIDDIEDHVFDERAAAVKEISYIRRQITSLRRIAIPLRRTITELTVKDIQRFSEEDLAPYFDDVKDHIDKAIEILEESKETVEIYKDTDFVHATDKSNKILAILTLIFTLSMPLSIISAIYGMNVDLPTERELDSNQLFGTYTTFILIVAATVTVTFGMWLYFRKIRWL